MHNCIEIDGGRARSTAAIRVMRNSAARKVQRHDIALGWDLTVRHGDRHALTIVGRVTRWRRHHYGLSVAHHAVTSQRPPRGGKPSRPGGGWRGGSMLPLR
jgi:hypothetical protein